MLTGGPGAGKTAVIAAARDTFCEHVALLPEAATILFGGGFPRHDTVPARAAAQRAIFHVQREGERLVDEERTAHTVVCDRGTVDGQAYWPGDPNEYWHEIDSTRDAELERYALVVHMRTPDLDDGYNHANSVRVEDAHTARALDESILRAWDGHPNRVVIDAQHAFENKLHAALQAIESVARAPLG